jgi:hypothetical protein
VPGLLQILDYARRVMHLANVAQQPDLEKAVGLRMQRQQILYETGRKFEFLIMESAAISRFCEPSVVIRQLNWLRFLFELPNVKIGFISNRVLLPRIPQNSFAVFDSSAAIVETIAGEVSTTDEHSIELYNATFDEFASVAAFGPDAQDFLDRCKHLLSSAGSVCAPPVEKDQMHPLER